MDRKTIDLDLSALSVKAGDGDSRDYFVIEGYASTYERDQGDDIVVPGAFSKAIQKGGVKFLWQHNPEEPIGRIETLQEDAKGLRFRAVLPKDDDFVAKRVIPQAKAGSLGGTSIGYRVKDAEYREDARLLKDIDLKEISLVTIPMNDGASIESIKGGSLGVEEFATMTDRQREAALIGRGLSKSLAKSLVAAGRDADAAARRDADRVAGTIKSLTNELEHWK